MEDFRKSTDNIHAPPGAVVRGRSPRSPRRALVLGCASYFVLLPALAYGYVLLNPPPAVLPPVLLATWILPVSFVNISQRGLIGRVRIGRRFLNLLVLSCALVAALLFWFWLLPRFLSSFPIGVNLPGGVRLGT